MWLFDILHSVMDYLLACVKMVQNREVGTLTINRKTGKYMREQQTLRKKMTLLLLFNPLTEWLDTTHLFRLWLHKSAVKEGKKEATPASKKQIQTFIDFFHINMNDFEPSDPSAYPTFEDFFIRHHKPGSRPINAQHDPKNAVVVADSRVVVYETVAQSKKIWIKGLDFSIEYLVMDNYIGSEFANGAVASFRLSPQDYHRYHSPVTGTIKQFRSMPGDYYEVDPIALWSGLDILTRNARDYVVIESEEFGDVLFVAIGASDVGSVRIMEQYQKPGSKINKGDELGSFQFGGSSIVVAFQQGRIKFDDDLLQASNRAISTDVEVGMSLGWATGKKKS